MAELTKDDLAAGIRLVDAAEAAAEKLVRAPENEWRERHTEMEAAEDTYSNWRRDHDLPHPAHTRKPKDWPADE